jgi:hypothetical protein
MSVGAGEDVVIVGDAGGTNDAVFRAKDEGAAITEFTNRHTSIKQSRFIMMKEVRLRTIECTMKIFDDIQ